MRILHVAYVYPPTPNVADGITNVVYNVPQELAKKGHEVAVYTSDMLDLHGNASLKTKKQVINGVIVYYLRSLLRHKTFIVTPSIIPLLSKRLSNFDIIHIHDSGLYKEFLHTCSQRRRMFLTFFSLTIPIYSHYLIRHLRQRLKLR